MLSAMLSWAFGYTDSYLLGTKTERTSEKSETFLDVPSWWGEPGQQLSGVTGQF